MKLLCSCLLIAAFLLPTGCAKKKEITPLQRKQAENMVSEAQFALSIREFARAEGLLVQATSLCPDTGAYWVTLGSTRVRMGQRDGARDAYKKALNAFENEADKNKEDAQPALQQVYVMALMGRVDDARALQDKLVKRYPNNREVRAFVDQKGLDRLLADPGFKQLSL
jgi:Tfp pilus assembly protein PilF